MTQVSSADVANAPVFCVHAAISRTVVVSLAVGVFTFSLLDQASQVRPMPSLVRVQALPSSLIRAKYEGSGWKPGASGNGAVVQAKSVESTLPQKSALRTPTADVSSLTPTVPEVGPSEESLAETRAPSLAVSKQSFDLVVLIVSHDGDTQRRAAVRASWLNYLKTKRCMECQHWRVKYGFLICLPDGSAPRDLVAEEAQYGDLVFLGNCKDDYKSLSAKVLSGVSWAVEHYQFSLLMKTDTDAYVYFDRLCTFLDRNRQTWSNGQRVVMGHITPNAGVQTSGKYADLLYKGSHYPPHPKGAGYIMTWPLAELLAREAPVLNSQFPNEDTAIGLWMTPFVHEFVPLEVDPFNPACTHHRLVQHPVDTSQLVSRWHAYEAHGDPCA